MILFLARQCGGDPASAHALLAVAEQPTLLDEILHHLRNPPAGLVNWQTEPARTILACSRACAHLARDLSRQTGLGQPESAWVCGLLAPLGWLLWLRRRSLGCRADARCSQEHACTLLVGAASGAGFWNLPDWLTAVPASWVCPSVSPVPGRRSCTIPSHRAWRWTWLGNRVTISVCSLPPRLGTRRRLSVCRRPFTGAWIRACQEAALARGPGKTLTSSPF